MTEQDEYKNQKHEIEKIASWGDTPKDVLSKIEDIAINISEFKHPKPVTLAKEKKKCKLSLEQFESLKKNFLNDVLNFSTSSVEIIYNGKKILSLFDSAGVFPVILDILSVISGLEELGTCYFFKYKKLNGFPEGELSEEDASLKDILFEPNEPQKKADQNEIADIIYAYYRGVDFVRSGIDGLIQKLSAYNKFFVEPLNLQELEMLYGENIKLKNAIEKLISDNGKGGSEIKVELNETEQELINALGKECMFGELLAKKAKLDFNSNTKQVLSTLVRRGIFENTSRKGYLLKPEYYHLIE